MAKSEQVTIKTYDSADEAKAAEALLLESGLLKNSVSRSGKKIRVDVQQEGVARSLLEGTEPSTYGGSSMTDEFTGSTSGSYSAEGETATEQVKDAASAVVDTVQDVASSTVDTAQQAAGAVVDKVQDATSVVTDQVAVVADAAAGKVENVADTVWQAGMQPGAPEVQRQAAQTAASVLDKTAEYLRERDLSLILDDLRSTIRRNPGRTLLLGLGLGYLARGSFFPSTGAPSSQGRMGSPMPPPMPRAVPVYTGEIDTGYNAAYAPVDTGFDAAYAPVDTSIDSSITYGAGYDTGTTETSSLTGDLSMSTMGGAGAVSDLSADELNTLAGGSDDTASSLYGSDLGTSSDMTSFGSDMSMGGTSGIGSTSSGAGLMGGDLGDTTLGLGDAGLGDTTGAGSLDSFGSSGSDLLSSSGDALGTGSEGSATGEGSITPSDDDLLGQWDAQTRGTNS